MATVDTVAVMNVLHSMVRNLPQFQQRPQHVTLGLPRAMPDSPMAAVVAMDSVPRPLPAGEYAPSDMAFNVVFYVVITSEVDSAELETVQISDQFRDMFYNNLSTGQTFDHSLGGLVAMCIENGVSWGWTERNNQRYRTATVEIHAGDDVPNNRYYS